MTKLNILLVEDNPGDVRLTQEAFREAKFANDVSAVPDGLAALDYVYQRDNYGDTARPDLVLLDINLPKISGHDVLKVVKDDDNLKQIPVIMLSSSTADSDIERSFDLNANGYIPKPYDIDGFKTVVCEVQKLFRSWGEQPTT